METLGDAPTMAELEQLAEILLREYSIIRETSQLADELMVAVGAIYECMSLRNGIEHVLETCTDQNTVEYLKQLVDRTSQHYVVIGDTELEE